MTLTDPEKPSSATLLFPDGKKVSLNLLGSKIGEDYIVDIRELKTTDGIVTFDPGFSSTSICHSSITYIDGDQGLCLYRGYPVHEIAFDHDFMTIAYLLFYGKWPDDQLGKAFENQIKSEMPIHQNLKKFFNGFMPNSHPMSILSSIVTSLSGLYLNPMELETNSLYEKERACLRIIGKVVTIAAMAYKFTIGEPFVYPKKELTYAENLLNMLFSSPSNSYTINKLHSKVINTFLNIHADHEQAASTCSLRTVGSSGANPYSCVGAAISSLWGRAHGGANEAVLKMLSEIESPDKIPEFIEQVKQKKRRLMGFGHRVYKSYDPRCGLMKKLCHQLEAEGNYDPTFKLAMELEKVALSDEYFIKRKLYPNVDFYSGISLRLLGIPNNMMTVMFAIGRTVGWVSQWKEMIQDLPIKIARPRQIYSGSERMQYSSQHKFKCENGIKVEESDDASHNRISSLIEAHKSATPPIMFDYEFDIWGESHFDDNSTIA